MEQGYGCYSYYQQYKSSGSFISGKEKRPPLKRGQLKRQIVRTLSNLMAPATRSSGDAAAAADSKKKAADRSSFRREASYN
ncbi:uncharacterized protein [Oryza sativa Japonica Group]|jgi:hypothetical protein|uniref:Os05g0465000 protein n=7 Tax=Oryza TaxID=4527 RepID=Q6I5K1_ORYSJ|nr:uncharacterized protein LOC4339041 [Oryza sativa Japonica Group]XP_052156879.1 uncharacterized protein LOC127774639 [Oryza glaberrima]EAY98352.1 hypothetical protein OsI_20261 [Oryza sativa Indica Group]KAB8099796.1 hypothetical protein EE612_030042 [Oryza sativa]AAT58776.1 unknown protein [Oryza sativa Japonica Group]EEE64014.1 hypothetical protein OsJ_18843 [Oryza sativa Japonica Group]KAF2931177.1 hypothetical protein DAI22_05g190500 [Oryza sativa Japonica Group]|eukprot:NP_001055780.1 Os05g0465000 [Oryza sativa Japonica Group]